MKINRVMILLFGFLLSATYSQSQVSYKRLLDAAREPQNWLTYSGRYLGWRYSTLNQIHTNNVSHLTMQWAFQVGDLGQFETTPLVVDGVLYGTGQNNRAFAIDARTGRAIWRYQRNLPEKLQPCCGMVNRGFAILGDRLFMATLDAHVIALDTKTGTLLWDVTAADYHKAYVASSMRTMQQAAGAYGVSIPCRGRGRLVTKRGPAILGKRVALRHGSRERTIRS